MTKPIALLLAALMLFTLAACGETPAEAPPLDLAAETTADPAADSDRAYVKSKGTLRVGIADFQPMDYKSENGEWIGFDADMAKAFAASLGVAVEFVEIDWDNKVLALNDKTIDCVWNGMTLTDDVTASMECSKPYCRNAQVIIVPAESAGQYQTIEDCRDLKFAVEADSAGEKEIEALGYAATPFKSQAAALTSVSEKTSEAAVIDLLMAAALVGPETTHEDLTYTVQLNSEVYGVGFRKGSDLASKLNIFLAAAYADGLIQKIAGTYGVQAALIPQNV